MSVIELDMVPSRTEGYDDDVSSQYSLVYRVVSSHSFRLFRAVRAAPSPRSTVALAKSEIPKRNCDSPLGDFAHLIKTLPVA